MRILAWMFAGGVMALGIESVINSLSADGRPSLSTSIRVWHDDARGVTCYVAEGREDNASIHCLPDSQLERKP